MATKKWSDLTPLQQQAIFAGGAAELLLTAAALLDLTRRPAPAVRGSKAAWAASFAVQPFGPLAYFAIGRLR